MASGKQTSVLLTVVVIIVSTIAVGFRAYRFKQDRDYRQAEAQRQIYERAKLERQKAEIQDKVFTPGKTEEAEAATIDPDTPPELDPVLERFKQLVPPNKDVPQVLSPFIKFIGHVHIGRRHVVGPTPAVSRDGKKFGMFDMADRYTKSGDVRFIISDIEYADDENIHRNSGLDMDDALSLHKRQVVDLGTTHVKNILNLTALDNGNWFWLKGNLYQESEFSGTPKKEPATCWFTWTGKNEDTPNKTCLESSQEYGDLQSVQISQNGAVGLFVQKKKTKDIKGAYNNTIPFLTYRLIAVDLNSGELMAESSIAPATEKDVELAAFFLNSQGTKAIISESFEQEYGTDGSVNFYNWNVAENKVIGETQTLISEERKRRDIKPTKIGARFAAQDSQTISLMYKKGAGQIIFDRKSGKIKSHHKSSEYAFSAGERASPKAWSGFPLANGNVLFVVQDKHKNVSWQVFNQTNKNILGQKSNMPRGLEFSYPSSQIAMARYSGVYKIYEVQE